MFELFFPSLSAVLSLTVIGIIFGLILSVAKLKLKVEKDPRIEVLIELLPGANCGACGFPGCAGYARKIVEGEAEINLCPAGGPEVINQIAGIMDVEAVEGGVSLKAYVHCQGGNAETTKRFIYEGPKECGAANNFMGGLRVCPYGCLGFGDCLNSCQFDAIYMNENDIPVIDFGKCTGCGNCVEACPRDIISLVPDNFSVYVRCKNKEKTPVMKKGCSVGCIGCKRCEKVCKENFEDNLDVETAIKVDNFLATIDYEICTNCYKCAEVCPVPVINPLYMAKKMKNSDENSEAKV